MSADMHNITVVPICRVESTCRKSCQATVQVELDTVVRIPGLWLEEHWLDCVSLSARSVASSVAGVPGAEVLAVAGRLSALPVPPEIMWNCFGDLDLERGVLLLERCVDVGQIGAEK
eukprot:3685206-Amphidinium_carterae.1